MHTYDGLASQQHHAFAFNVDLYAVGIPFALLCFPWLVTRVLRTETSVQFPYWPNFWWLFGAAFSWYWAVQLPNIPITSETQSTTMHLMGGALMGPLLFAYFARAYGIKKPDKWWIRYILLYVAVGGFFGVSNELVEFLLTKTGVLKVDLSDTSWDTAANVAGLTLAFAVTEIVGYLLARRRRPTPVAPDLQHSKA